MLPNEVEGADRRTSEDLLLAAYKLLLFFFREDKVALLQPVTPARVD